MSDVQAFGGVCPFGLQHPLRRQVFQFEQVLLEDEVELLLDLVRSGARGFRWKVLLSDGELSRPHTMCA